MYNNKITRRDFLKFLGSGAAVAVVGMTLGKLNVNPVGNTQLPTASADQITGSWSLGTNLFKVPVHVALLPSGKIFFLSGDGEDTFKNNGPYYAGTLDLNTNSQNQLTVPDDISCGGNCLLPSGNVLLGGGTLMWNNYTPNGIPWGLDKMYEFDFSSESFIQHTSMAHGRWYPTFSLLPDGTVQIISGWDEFGCLNRLVEIYDPATQSLSIKYDPNTSLTYCVGGCNGTSIPGAGSPCYGGPNKGVVPVMSLYPRMHLMPNGLLAMVGQGPSMRAWDPKTGKWYFSGQEVWGNRSFGTSVLLPLQNTTTETGKIIIAGGASSQGNVPATNSAELIVPNNSSGTALRSQLTNPMNFARQYLNSVMLPTGQVFINGGSTLGNNVNHAVYQAEMFDPVTNTWTTLPSATVPRLYHSVAMLTQDGRIWTGSTTIYGPYKPELRTEIFSPAYVFSTRPTILGTPIITGGYGGSITIPTPDAANITSVSLVKISSVTHHNNADQRLIWLQIQSTTPDSVTVAAPISPNLAPSGYYLVHVLSNGIPSVGQFIKI